MKRRRTSAKRMLSLILVVAMVLACIPLSVFAVGETRTVYLNAGGGSLWDQANAWFDAWVWGSAQGEDWYTFTDTDGDGVYAIEIPADATGMKILRKDPANTAHSWDSWNNTGDLTIGTYNMYTITGWGESDGKWSDFVQVEPVYTVAGVAELCGSGWNITDAANNMTKNASGNYEKVYTNVAAGSYEFKVVKDANWGTSWPSANYVLNVAEDGSTVTITYTPATKTVSATAQVPVQPAGATVYFINSANWATVSAYAWTTDGAGLTWPGNAMTKTGTTVNGYDVYAITFEAQYENIIFNNTTGTQTADLTLMDGQCYDMATGEWYASVQDVPSAEPVQTGYYLVGYINNADYSGDAYPFVDGKLTVTFQNDSYVVVKDGSGDWYMCQSYCTGDTAVLTKGHSEKMYVAAGTEVTFTLVENADGTLTLSYAVNAGGAGETTTDYYLVGYINNVDYSGDEYKFTDGKLTATFQNDSYVVVKDGSGDWYMCQNYCTGDTAVLTKGHSEKMFVAGGTEVTFTLAENGDGTLTLSYAAGSGETGGEETTDVSYEATFHFANTLGWGAVNLYTWSQAGSALTGGWPGTATSQDADGFYSMTVKYQAPAGQGLNYIFNNGGTQTVDLALAADAFDENNKAEIWVVLTTQTDGKYNATAYTSGDAIAISPIVKDTSVTFQYQAPDASSVEVRGTMCGWEDGQGVAMTKNNYGIWSVTIDNIAAGIHEYKFVADGTWTADPLNTWTENGNSAFLISDPSQDINQVTVIVHYNRTDGSYENWNLYMWNENGADQYDFVAGDGEVTTSIVVEGRATQSVNFKVRKSVGSNMWAAEEGQVTVDLSTIVSGTIHVYTGGKYANNQTLEADVVYANKISDVQYDYEANTVTIYTNKSVQNPETAFGLVKDDADAAWAYDAAASAGGAYVFTLTDTPDLAQLYRYKVRFYEQAEAFHTVNYDIGIDSVYASDKFAAEYTYTGNDLGANYYADSTTFRLWAPTAEEVSVRLYATGSDAEEGAADLGTYSLSRDVNGTWVDTILGNLKNVYYTYLVKVDGKTVEANDPYSKATGVNGQRSMVIDLEVTNPDGWYDDANPNPVTSQTDAVIYELHVRDFSIDESSGVSEANRGKFLAFTETGTTVNGEGQISTGIDYLADLGITHLHLLPIYDYESVDETTCDGFNWGYDPQNYNVPEGSYSTNPYDGNVRVYEMKQMVMALHENGISVVMDVVYNHVYDASTFSFNQIVPGYFSRVDSNTSGCGNDTASEREMVRKYIVESVLYWTEEYHIDGFRFDLVGLLDVETINQIVEEVHAVRPDVIFYGEGWDMDGTNKEPGTEMAKQGNASKTPGFAYFSDSIRNGLGGSNDGTATGFASGAGNGGAMATEWMANPWWTANPEQVIQYASCHDNYTLADKIILSTGRTSLDATVVKMNNLAAAFYMTAQGVPFIHAGEEMLREKINPDGSRNHNSYNSSDEVNHIEWSNLEDQTYADTSAYYQGLIAFRKAHPALRYSTAALVKDNVQTREASGNLMVMRIDGNGAGDDDILVIFNAGSADKTVSLPEGEWEIYIQGATAGTTVLGTASGTVTVAGISATVLTKEDEGVDEEEPLGASEEKTIYFSNNKYWSQVYAYAWTDGGEKALLGAWPGTAMTYVEKNEYGEDIFSVTLPASETGIEGVIFTDGSEQTVDVQPGVDGTGYYCTDKDADGKYMVGTYTYRAPQLGGADDFFLGGWINGADYTGADYKFGEDGTLTTTFDADSYVYVVDGTGTTTYMTDGWLGSVTQATLYDSTKLSAADKLMIPGGSEVTLTLVPNDDGTLTLSYAVNVPSVVDGTGIQNGVTLHCWNWSFAEIEANMAAIAAQGYTAVQTSPVQPLKEATNLSYNTVNGNWWVYYQPVDFTITTASGNALGTKAELQSMIETAHQYGVKVIVDVVANHLGNQTGNDLSDEIPEYLRKSEFWHDITTNTTDWNDRYDITQHCMSGLPDLNTANKELQNIVLDYLKELVDAGVDGFRFDGAKHIETQNDDASFASDFWPTVVGGAEDYAQSQYGKDLYVYGELLDTTGGVGLSAYTQYMAITDNSWGTSLRKNIEAGNAALAAGYDKAADASVLVLWAESHDNYMTDDSYLRSYETSEEDINKTWALVAARADAMGLYFARPESLNQAIGVASVTGWANDEVAAVNKFHNAFAGQSEVVSNENGVSYVERGTTGVVLVQVAQTGSTSISVSAHAMAEGTYVDQITGNVFTVANGVITGTIGETGIAVVYNAAEAPTYENTVTKPEGGTVTVDDEAPELGQTVTITAKPDEGKQVDKVTVTDANGNEVAVTDNGDGTYSFAQPNGSVTITVTFSNKITPPTGDNAQLVLWITLMNVSVLAVAVLLLGQRRRRHQA